jgi:hypothetical protein
LIPKDATIGASVGPPNLVNTRFDPVKHDEKEGFTGQIKRTAKFDPKGLPSVVLYVLGSIFARTLSEKKRSEEK